MRRFEETGSVSDGKKYQHPRSGRSNENIAAVSGNMREKQSTSIRHRSQQLDQNFNEGSSFACLQNSINSTT